MERTVSGIGQRYLLVSCILVTQVIGAEKTGDKMSLWVDGPHLRGMDLHACRLIDEDGVCIQKITRQDLQDLRDLGANLVNASYTGVYTEHPPYEVAPEALEDLDNLITWIEGVGLYVVIHFRTGPGRNEAAITWDDDPDVYLFQYPMAADFRYPDVIDYYGETIVFDRQWLEQNYEPVLGFAQDPNFVVIGQNAAELAAFDDYVDIVDAIAQTLSGHVFGVEKWEYPLRAEGMSGVTITLYGSAIIQARKWLYGDTSEKIKLDIYNDETFDDHDASDKDSIREFIRDGRPVIRNSRTHSTLIIGYATLRDQGNTITHLLKVNDPWVATEAQWIELESSVKGYKYYILPALERAAFPWFRPPDHCLNTKSGSRLRIRREERPMEVCSRGTINAAEKRVFGNQERMSR